ncbi:MAG: DUF3450 domain-containing protein [Thermodesulfobacteriota bacterium]|nr:DUF3450 domain-containing protein [Thermodesulfobacteriota bacterium]
MGKMHHCRSGVCLAIGILAVLIGMTVNGLVPSAHAEARIDQPVRDAIDIRQKTQQNEEAWRQEKAEKVARLESLEAEQAALKQQKQSLEDDIQGTEQRLAEKKTQLTDIQQISEQITPFLDKLVARLEAVIADDLDFLPEERNARIDKIRKLVDDPDVDTSEKYRKIMEALFIEAEYGFTTEVYQDTIVINGQERLVNIFRLGRISLFYLTLNRSQCGFYNVAEKQWQPLSGIHLAEVEAAVDIAARRRTAELLTLPLGRIVTP